MSTVLHVTRAHESKQYLVPQDTPIERLFSDTDFPASLDTDTFPAPHLWAVEMSDGEAFGFGLFIKEAGGDNPISELGEQINVICVRPAEPITYLPMTIHHGTSTGKLSVLPQATAAQVKAALAEMFTGPIEESIVEYPGKTAGVFRPLPDALSAQMDIPMIERVSARIASTLPLMRPPVPDSISSVRVVLAEGCKLLAVAEHDSELDTIAAAAAAKHAFQAQALVGLAKFIRTSKMGMDGDRDLAAMMCREVLTFTEEGPPGKKVRAKCIPCIHCKLTHNHP